MTNRPSQRSRPRFLGKRTLAAFTLTAGIAAIVGGVSFWLLAGTPEPVDDEELRRLGFHIGGASERSAGRNGLQAARGNGAADGSTSSGRNAPGGGTAADDSLNELDEDGLPEDGGRLDDSLEGLPALSLKLSLLEKGREQLSQTPGYTATFYKKERVGGKLLDGQVMEVKLRHEPFSLYMKWLVGDKGRELIYVEGENNGKTVLHMGGWKARLLPPLRLDPNGTFAMEESRHPVTGFGMKNLAERLIQYRERDVKQAGEGVSCRMINNQVCNDRDCYNFIIEYEGPQYSETYRKSEVYIDQEWLVPICIRNYAWAEAIYDADPKRLDETTLIEHYSYSNIQFDCELTDLDFDYKNEDYDFRR